MNRLTSSCTTETVRAARTPKKERVTSSDVLPVTNRFGSFRWITRAVSHAPASLKANPWRAMTAKESPQVTPRALVILR